MNDSDVCEFAADGPEDAWQPPSPGQTLLDALSRELRDGARIARYGKSHLRDNDHRFR
jgi:hypothetical protein